MINRIKIVLTVKKPNELIKRLIDEKINLYQIEEQNNQLICVVDIEDYEKIKKIKKISNYKIIEYYGKSKIKYQFKKYKILLLSIIIGILINILLSNIILKIEIETPNKELKEHVRKELNDLGLKKFHWKLSKENIKQIKEHLLEKEYIEWIEIDNIGTKYIVTIEEKKKKEKTSCPLRNVVSKKNAIITKVESSTGEIIKKKQDYVEKGEIIISGIIHNKEEEVSIKCAEGKVWGEVWYKVIVEIPKEETKIKKTNQTKWVLQIGKYKESDKWQIKKEYNIIKSNLYPIKVSLLYLQKINISKTNYTLSNIDQKSYQEAEKKLEKYLSMKPHIISKKVLKKSTKNSKIIIEVFFSVEEEITSYQEIKKEG